MTMNKLLDQINKTGTVEDSQGKSYKHNTSSVTREVGSMLYHFVRSHPPKKTIEIGMAYGISSLYICQALWDNGMGNHTAIDPFEVTRYQSIGLLNIQRAGLNDIFKFYNESSQKILPHLWSQNDKYDFAFIDGSHHFDYALVDFFLIDKLLDPGGYVAFDDLWMPGVRKIVSFVLNNLQYKLVPSSAPIMSPFLIRLLRIGRRILQDPLERNWSLKLMPHNIAFLKKTGDDQKAWDYYKAF